MVGIMAAVLAARKLAQHDPGKRVRASLCAIADAVRWGEQILNEIDQYWPVKYQSPWTLQNYQAI